MDGGGSKEPKDAKVLRQRQLMDLADLDEEENRRIKALFRARQGGRAFRAPTAARTATDTAGAGGGGGSLIPASGFTGGRGGSVGTGVRGGTSRVGVSQR